MILTKSPLRISFFGGGSDISSFYSNYPGLCISTTIDSYIYLAVHRCVADHLKVIYSQLELEKDVDKIKHNRVRETLKLFNINSNIEICSFSDIPVAGTGLGSSSTFTVGLVNAICNLLQIKQATPQYLATTACQVEINRCREPIGKQDQYAAAFGGFNAYRFYDDHVEIEPIAGFDVDQLSSNLMCFNTGISRNASVILSNQTSNLKTNQQTINQTKMIVDIAEQSLKYLKANRIDDFGQLLDQSWQIKKTLSDGISSSEIDEMYETALNNGAIGGKILGAGGGGYLLLYVKPQNQTAVYQSLSDRYKHFKFKFTQQGSTIGYRQ